MSPAPPCPSPPGELLAIFLAEEAGAPMRSVAEAEAVAGEGLAGDRYRDQAGFYSPKPRPGRELSLIEAEALEAAERDYDCALAPEQSRRNLLTRGVALNHLVGRRFRIGEVELLGAGLCEPCRRLEELSFDGAYRALVHRGGLRAQILRGGEIRVGDRIRIADLEDDRGRTEA